MAKQSQQKLKLLYIYKLLNEKSDEQNPISTKNIISYLNEKGIPAERKSIYDDLESLKNFGVDIISAGKSGSYIGSRNFELAELKLLVDCVQANHFITEKKSNALIKKLEGLTSHHLAQSLQRQIYVANRIKGMNEKIYYNIDTLHDAIIKKKNIAFQYFTYTPDKQKQLKRDGADYVASPYALCVSEEKYYLISYYEKRNKITNFRVDRMENIRILKEDAPDLCDVTEPGFALEDYSKKNFSMYTGENRTITLLCENNLINAIIDRFGEKIIAVPYNDTHFTVKAEVNISPTFFSWIFTFAGGIQIVAPNDVVAQFNQQIQCFLPQDKPKPGKITAAPHKAPNKG